MYIERTPNIVFLDINLPDGNGHDLAHKIKQQNPAAYIVMATASHDVDDKIIAAQTRVDGFITKPFDKKQITNYIEQYLASHRQSSKA